jgi:hypothetical protein
MNEPRRPRRKQTATARPPQIASVRIRVLERFGPTTRPLGGVLVEGLPFRKFTNPQTGEVSEIRTTNDQGIFESDGFLAGKRRVTLTKAGFGPFPPAANRGVVAGPVVREETFVPNIQLDPDENNEVINRLEVVVAQEGPTIAVRVLNVTPSTPVPIASARVEIIGIEVGATNSFGDFTSVPLPFGRRGINVRADGFVPEKKDGDFFQEVELNELSGRQNSNPPNRNLRLVVNMVLPPRTFPLPGTHPRPIAIWASGGATPHAVAADPRLPAPGGGDTPQGQDDWDIGINYGTTVTGEVPSAFVRLTRQLEPGGMTLPAHVGGGTIEENQIRRLAIVAHGDQGVFDADQFEVGQNFGHKPNPASSLTLARLASFESSFDRLRKALQRDALLYLVACNLADGDAGEQLLREISLRLPTIRVVALRTICAVPVTSGRKDGALFAGLRDTIHKNPPNPPKDFEDPAVANNLTRLPWFSETSTHATVVLDGNVIRLGSQG